MKPGVHRGYGTAGVLTDEDVEILHFTLRTVPQRIVAFRNVPHRFRPHVPAQARSDESTASIVTRRSVALRDATQRTPPRHRIPRQNRSP